MSKVPWVPWRRSRGHALHMPTASVGMAPDNVSFCRKAPVGRARPNCLLPPADCRHLVSGSCVVCRLRSVQTRPAARAWPYTRVARARSNRALHRRTDESLRRRNRAGSSGCRRSLPRPADARPFRPRADGRSPRSWRGAGGGWCRWRARNSQIPESLPACRGSRCFVLDCQPQFGPPPWPAQEPDWSCKMSPRTG